MEQKYPIGSRGYYALVSEFQGYAMVHIRKFYEGNPTKFGIALSKREWSILMNRAKKLDNLIKQMQKALEARKDSKDKEQFESESFHIGLRGFYAMITEFKDSLFVHVRHFNEDGKPTTKGVALNLQEWEHLTAIRENINTILAPKQKEEAEGSKKSVENGPSPKKRRLFKVDENEL